MLLHLFGLMAMFLGVMLLFCARDLARRGTLVMWEGVPRLCGGVTMAGFGVLGNGTVIDVGAGLFDFSVAVIHLVGLPRFLGVSFGDLLWDRR